MDIAPKKFASIEDELNYWKAKALEFKQKYDDSRTELDDYTTQSRELETEMEAQIEHMEAQLKDLRVHKTKLENEYDILKDKMDKLQSDSSQDMARMQKDLNTAIRQRDEYNKYIRELEQSNDDLERAKRATIVSIEDFEGRLNQAIERNAFLENELDDKEQLVVAVQRMKDETRDLKQELNKQRVGHNSGEPDNDKMAAQENGFDHMVDSNKLANAATAEIFTQTVPGSPIRTSMANGSINPTASLTPSSRISALNIVGDLLRKVGALESKLANCRSFAKDTTASPRVYQAKGSPHNSPRAKRVNRGESGIQSPKLNHTNTV